MKIFPGWIPLAEPISGITSSDLGSLPVRVLGTFGLASLRSLLFWRFLALVGGWVRPVLVAKKPLDTTFTFEMLCSAPPLAVRAVENSEAIFHLKLLELDVDLAITSYTYKISGVGSISNVRLGRRSASDNDWCSVLAVPSDGCFVIKL